MVIGAFPIAKLGTLLLRQISKPLANMVKERAKSSPFFRTYICMPPAQFYNWCEVKVKMWIMDLGKPSAVPTLNETMAIELGANLLGEGIIFATAAAVLYLEYARQVRKEAAKEQARVDEINSLNGTIKDLYFTTEKQDAQIRELTRMILDLESRVVSKPWVRKSPIQNDKPPENPPPPAPELKTSTSPSPPNLKVVSNLHDSKSRTSNSGFILQAVEYLQKDVIHLR
ncbi:optic atrophy 3 protein homolog [Anabrus simplex]|uniref:optic atrophy 3 protein homolog n=1 Tax=Anabrus simplex TaxID=316456 RepID=UPI0035A31F97